MLYMIVSTHSPESCPMGNPETAKKAQSMMQRMDEVAKKYGIKVQGAWNNVPSHTAFMVVDAPNTDALGLMAIDLGTETWTTSRLYPIEPMQASVARIK